MDQTPTLYRVAHVSTICEGMYRNGTACAHLNEIDRHPMPYNDMLLEGFYTRRFRDHMRFAFASLEQLRFWVYKAEVRERLAEAGYLIYQIEPEGERGIDWQIGDTQAIYTSAREVGMLDLRDI